MKIHNTSYIVAVIMMLDMVMVGACGHHKEAGYSQVDSSVFETVMPDTILEEPLDTLPPPPVKLDSTEEQLRYMAESPDSATYFAGIIPDISRDVPEYASKLLMNEADGFLIVDKNTMKLYRYDRWGVEMERVGVAVAKPFGSKHKRRDNRTPEGYFTIEGIYDSTDWLYTDDDGKTSEVKGQFGPRFMRLRTPVSAQIGIHGTVAPWSIGGRRSHGCIRMTNENIMRFAEICKPGWPVIVSPGPRDMRVNEEEGYDIPSVPVIPGRPRCKPGKAIKDPDADKLERPDDTSDSTSPESENPSTGESVSPEQAEGSSSTGEESATPQVQPPVEEQPVPVEIPAEETPELF